MVACPTEASLSPEGTLGAIGKAIFSNRNNSDGSDDSNDSNGDNSNSNIEDNSIQPHRQRCY